MNAKAIGLTVAVGCALLADCAFGGFYDAKDDAGRIAAMSELSTSDLKSILYNEHLSCAGFFDKMKDPSYSTEVKIGAIDQLFRKGEIYELVKLADDYRIGDGSKFGGQIPAAIQQRMCTPEGLDKLCDVYEEGRSTSANRMLLGMACGNNDTYFAYVARNINRRAIRETFTGDAMKALGKIKDADALASVGRDVKCNSYIRATAASMILGKYEINAAGVRHVVGWFDDKDDESWAMVLTAAMKRARQLSDDALYNEVKLNTLGLLKESRAMLDARDGKVMILGANYLGIENWRSEFLGEVLGYGGIERSCCDNNRRVTKFVFNESYCSSIDEYKGLEYEAWVRKFISNHGKMASAAKLMKDENGKITVDYLDARLTFKRKGGMLMGIEMESLKEVGTADVGSTILAAAFMGAMMNAMNGGGQVGTPMVQPQMMQQQPTQETRPTISVAKQNGSSVDVYDAKGMWKFSRPNAVLQGYTSESVSVKESGGVSVYDAQGKWMFSK